MAKQNFIYRIYQNARKPEGFIGRLILKGMNCGHKPVADWAMSHLQWQSQWQILDIGCGGGVLLEESGFSDIEVYMENKEWLCVVAKANPKRKEDKR